MNGLVQLIRMGKYIRHKWVKMNISLKTNETHSKGLGYMPGQASATDGRIYECHFFYPLSVMRTSEANYEAKHEWYQS